MARSTGDRNGCNEIFLPDFCNFRTVFAVVITCELLAFVLALAYEGKEGRWYMLSLYSLFIQWIGLGSAALLCATRPILCGMSNRKVAVISYLMLLALTLIVSEVSFHAISNPGTFSLSWTERYIGFHARNLAISAIISAIVLRYLYIQHLWKVNMEAESRSRLQALQSRIRPHFLFNSMNVIASLTRSQPQRAEEIIEDLSDLFRVSLADASKQVTLAEELDIARRYLRIEKLRLDDRLLVTWDLDALPEDALVPALLLQPLLENAVFHGIEPRPDGGTIAISGNCESGQIRISISNPVTAEAGMRHREGNRMALDNIRQRLEYFYEGEASLDVDETGDEYHVVIEIPYLQERP